MNKELEEAAEMYADKQSDASMRKDPLEYSKSGEELWDEAKTDFIEGAKWMQERMYSEEEVLEIIRQYALEEHLITSSKPDIWFEQFKKGRKD